MNGCPSFFHTMLAVEVAASDSSESSLELSSSSSEEDEQEEDEAEECRAGLSLAGLSRR